MNNELPFKVKCIITPSSGTLTKGKEYEVISVEYSVDDNYYETVNDNGDSNWYFASRFEIVETLKDKQEFSVGDEVVVNKISDDFVSSSDENVKVGDVVTVIKITSYDVELSNPSWKNSWWFYKTDVSLVESNNPLNNNFLFHQEVIQAVIDGKELEIQYIDGKELEIQYIDGTWHRMLYTITTLRQLVNLNFRLKPSPSLEYKRKAVIKKLLETKVAVLCKCWCNYECGSEIVAITSVDDSCTYPYVGNNLNYKNAYAIDDNGNEITNL